MAVVYIADQGASICKRGDRLYIYKGPALLRWFHTKDIEQLIVVGNIAMTAQAVTYLLKNKIDTVFLSYYGKFKGRLVGELGKNVARRMAQFKYLEEEQKQTDLALLYVCGKISNSLVHLEKRMRKISHPIPSKVFIQNRALLHKLERGVQDKNSLRGYEGIAAKNYFSAFPYLISNPDFKFQGRNKRPPRDEINALLSLGYTFLMNQIMTAVYIGGLDPYLGALHDIDYGRQSLVLDVMEEFRPLIDNLVISLVNRREIRLQHFKYNAQPDEECTDDDLDEKSRLLPVCMTPEGMKILITAFSKLINSSFVITDPPGTWRLSDIFLIQARKLCAVFESGNQYTPFVWK